MNRVDLQEAQWFKSSYSNGNGNCIEVAHLDDTVATRDSKLHTAGPVVTTGAGVWQAFICGVVAGTFDAS